MHDELVIPGDLSIPEFLRQHDTPERKEARAALTKVLSTRRLTPQGEPRRAKLTDADQQVIGELLAHTSATKKAKAALRIAKMLANKSGDAAKMPLQGKEALKAIATKEATVTSVGPKEAALRDVRAGKKPNLAHMEEALGKLLTPGTKAVVTSAAITAPTGTTNGATVKEKVGMKAVATKKQATEKKTKVTAKPKKAVAKNGHKPVNKMQMVEDMLLTKKGVTREEMSEASGWPYVNLNVALERVRKTHPKAKLENTNGRFRFVSP